MSAKRTRISPRIRIKEDGGVKTTRSKTADSGLFVGSISPFSDNKSLPFVQTTVVYPTMLQSGSVFSDVAGITATGRMTPGASDVHFSYVEEKSQPFKDVTSLDGDFYRQPVEGMAGSFAGPLTSRTAIKIDISSKQNKYLYRCSQRLINNSPGGEFASGSSGFYYFNFVNKVWNDIGLTDPLTGAKLTSEQSTSVTASSIPVSECDMSGTVHYAGQFVPPNHINSRGIYEVGSVASQPLTFEDHVALGVKKIGTPTTTFFAPNASKYHATASNVIRMSDYISGPFLLEKIRVDFPNIVARRTHDFSQYAQPSGLTSHLTATNDLLCRDMDNYVVFLYRQSRRAQTQIQSYNGDAPRQEVSSSMRFLVASASLCFYNSPTHRAGQFGLGLVSTTYAGVNSDDFPFHSPQFKHDFNMPTAFPTASSIAKTYGYYSGSVSLKMVPTISPEGLSGVSFLPISTASNGVASYFGLVPTTAGYQAHSYFQHAWPGTAGSIPMGDYNVPGSRDYSGKNTPSAAGYFHAVPAMFKTYSRYTSINNVSYTNYINVDEYFFKAKSITTFDFSPYLEKELQSISRPDPRSFMSSFGPGKSELFTVEKIGFTDNIMMGACTTGPSAGRSTPIVLLPSDELILGIDAGIAPFMRDLSTITGSYLRIDAGEATLTLYGSQTVSDERRINQRSIGSFSEDVHTFDAGDAPVDEFFLEPPGTKYGNYYAPPATGSGINRSVQSFNGAPTLFPQAAGYKKWLTYPRFSIFTSDRSATIDRGQNERCVFRVDKFGQPANLLSFPYVYASNISRPTILPGFKTSGRTNSFYPVTNVFTGSSSFSGNLSLHATSSSPFSDS